VCTTAGYSSEHLQQHVVKCVNIRSGVCMQDARVHLRGDLYTIAALDGQTRSHLQVQSHDHIAELAFLLPPAANCCLCRLCLPMGGDVCDLYSGLHAVLCSDY
jgi:hypothetical protein